MISLIATRVVVLFLTGRERCGGVAILSPPDAVSNAVLERFLHASMVPFAILSIGFNALATRIAHTLG